MDDDGQHNAVALDVALADLQIVLQDLEDLTEDDYRD
jgi:hypothetical protein